MLLFYCKKIAIDFMGTKHYCTVIVIVHLLFMLCIVGIHIHQDLHQHRISWWQDAVPWAAPHAGNPGSHGRRRRKLPGVV